MVKANDEGKKAPSRKSVPTKAVVSRTYLVSGKVASEHSEEETLEVRQFVTPPAKIGLEYGLTVNMGNYNSARVSVTLELPCYVEEINEAYHFAEEWVAARISLEKDQLKKRQNDSIF